MWVYGLLCLVLGSPSAQAARVEIKGEWLMVDGEPFLVKGVGYSPYRPGQLPWKSRVDPALMAKDFARIREAGFNTIRTWAPLSAEELRLADEYGLMVLQGIWIERRADFTNHAFHEATQTLIQREVAKARDAQNILAFLVGNELQPEQVIRAGVSNSEQLLRRAAEAVRQTDARRLVSHANWPHLGFLDASDWDVVAFNVYPYEPVSVAKVFGFGAYLEHLKRTLASGRPLLITETGLSVSSRRGNLAGYGGYTAEGQRDGVLKLWNALFEAGTQGGCVFEWNDEWWKNHEAAGDELTHDEADPEEWFGLIAFRNADDLEGEPRPVYEALARYNHAILVEPNNRTSNERAVPVQVYVTDRVGTVRVRLDRGKWQTCERTSPHWFKTSLPLRRRPASGRGELAMEAFDRGGALLVRQERPLQLGRDQQGLSISLETDQQTYHASQAMQSIAYTVRLLEANGRPRAKYPVDLVISEPQVHEELILTSRTDASGLIRGSYLVREPGIITLAAGTFVDPKRKDRRVATERHVVIAPSPPGALAHRPSRWERALPDALREALRHDQPAFSLHDAGTKTIVDYARYGRSHGIGTPQYRYEVLDWGGLANAVGEGVYPNESVFQDPAYRQALDAGRLDGSHWDFTYHDDINLSFLKWATTDEEPGVKQFYTALTLERAGLWAHAIKAYYAILVHFPTSIGWTAFDPPTPWYVGKVARDRIEAILRLHPELGMRLVDARITVQNGFDNDIDNDVILTYPGALVPASPDAPDAVNPPTTDLAQVGIAREVGSGRVRLRQYANGHWQLLVDSKPWIIRGITYQPSAVGESPDEGTLKDWMTADRNQNGKPDGPFDTFVDANRNNRQDPEEPTVGDFQLLKTMGVNTVRLYHHASNKPLLRELYERYGIMVLMGDLVGMYTVGSGAKWEEGTNYLDPAQRARMVESVKQMVMDHKDEPYVLMWVLGNENNYGGQHGIVGGVGNAGMYPKEFYGFVNELAQWIHSVDPNHPVAIANGDAVFLDLIAQALPAVDVFGTNIYRGSYGPGRALFEEVKRLLDKPVFVSEFGCPAYQLNQPREVAEAGQALYHLGNWVDLDDNTAGSGIGNSLGGIVFEWVDEWWKAGQPPRALPHVQETKANWPGPFPGGKMFEEWLGIMSQGDGSQSPYLRQERLSYRLYQALWHQQESP